MLIDLDGTDPSFFPDISHPFFKEDYVAIGGDLSAERLLSAYFSGAFPMYSEDVLLWWSFFPRLLIIPKHAKFSKSLFQRIRKKEYKVKFDCNFAAVIGACRQMKRDGGWITDSIVEAYIELHKKGFAHSVETYFEGQLVGGLYGVQLGGMFAGESMFHLKNDASKVAFYYLVQAALFFKLDFIDCQQISPHFLQWGGETFTKTAFFDKLNASKKKVSHSGSWSFLNKTIESL